jgi:eukaryotic-like serine/threonine-protein kinase
MESSLQSDERMMEIVADASRQPAEERERYLQTACNGDEELRRAVDQALACEAEMGDFLQTPWLEFARLNSPFKPGEIVADRFEIVREIGEGGMGVVYEALDRKRNLKIAIKAAKPGFQRLLTPELEGALQVRHHNICLVNQIHTAQTDFGEIDFLSMELLDGITLAEYLEANGKMPGSKALEIARQLCAGLAEAHHSGIIHRDLKTSNVFLCQEGKQTRVVITDFGLAGPDTQEKVLAGTPRYIGPEIWQGKPASKASDIYALGVILYELVEGPQAGWQPSLAASEAEWRSSEGMVPLVAPLEIEEDGLPKRWVRTIRACLGPDPEARPADAMRVLAGLEKPHKKLIPLLLVPVLLVGVALSPPVWKIIHDLIWPPPALRLVLLPPTGAESSAIIFSGALEDVSRRLSNLRSGTRSVVAISPGQAKDLGVTTAEEAQKRLHASHALQTSAVNQGDDTVVQGAVIDLETQTHVRDFSFHYTPATLGALPGALAGEVSTGLGLQGVPAVEPLSAVATGPYDRGLNLYQQDEDAEAIRFYEEAGRLDLRSPLPLAALVEAEVQRFKDTKDAAHLARAQQYLQTAESLGPDSVSVHLAAGRLYEATGKLEKALDEYLRVRSLAPANINAALRATRVYDSLDMPDKAIAEYRRAIALDPAFFQPYRALGAFYFHRGAYSAAAEQWRKVTELTPGSYRAWSDLAAALKNLGDYEGAEQALRKGLQLREHPDLLQNMGSLLSAQGRDAEAVPYYERAAALKPGEYIIWYNLGDSNRRLGRRKAARDDYQRGLRLVQAELQQNPHHGFARSLAAILAARLGQRSWALDETAQALHAAPADAVVLRLAVLTYEALGDRQQALDCLRNATPELLRELDGEPDLADFRRDPRFQQLVAKPTGGK